MTPKQFMATALMFAAIMLGAWFAIRRNVTDIERGCPVVMRIRCPGGTHLDVYAAANGRLGAECTSRGSVYPPNEREVQIHEMMVPRAADPSDAVGVFLLQDTVAQVPEWVR